MSKLFASALMGAALMMGSALNAATVNFVAGSTTIAESVTGVDVSGTIYDVTFDGSTSTVDIKAAGYPFATQAEASVAATALAAALTYGGATAARLSTTTSTTDATVLHTFYSDDGSNALSVTTYFNGPDWINVPGDYRLDSGWFPFTAVWTDAGSASPIPLPAGGLLLFSAFGGLMVLRRRKKSA